MPARLRAADGAAGGFNAVQKLLTNLESRQRVKAAGQAGGSASFATLRACVFL